MANNISNPVSDDSGMVRGKGGKAPRYQDPKIKKINDLAQKEIERAMGAIQSRFRLNRQSLIGDRSEVGSMWRFMVSALNRQRKVGLRNVSANFAARGLNRSGLYLQDRAEFLRDIAEQKNQGRIEKQQQLDEISLALQQLVLARDQEKVETKKNILTERNEAREAVHKARLN